MNKLKVFLKGFLSWKSLLAGVLGAVFILIVYKNSASYQFVHEMLTSNYKGIKSAKESGREDFVTRLSYKIGGNVAFIISEIQKLPDTAVIIIPSMDEAYINATNKQDFGEDFFNRRWLGYFVYPHIIVFSDEKGKVADYDKAKHVLILNGVGTSLLEYSLNIPSNYIGILPIHQKDFEIWYKEYQKKNKTK